MKTVLITGASSGIGRQLAKQFAAHDYSLILVARRENLLQSLQEELIAEYKVDAKYFVCDIAKNPKDVYNYCKENNIRVDVLVNNAGYGDYGKFIDSDLDKALGMIELNDASLVSLTYYFIQDMKENGYGHILNVGSVASFVPGPYMAVYYATKAFVMSFSVALREELRKDNIHVSVLCPGPTDTEFFDVANANFDKMFARTSTDAAKTGYKLFEDNKAYAVDGLSFKVLVGIARVMPIELAARAVGFIQSKTKKEK